jgi:hypothetical protein
MLLLLCACLGLDGGPAAPSCDVDGDGAVTLPCADSASPVDCDDADPLVFPGAFEACDGVDNDCSGVADDPADGDGDGFSVCVDCDDGNPAVFPGAEELCDGVDNDCSGAADEAFDLDGDGYSPCAGDCDDADPLQAAGLLEVCDGRDNDCDGSIDEGFDADGDGWLTCRGDCDDADATVWYGAPEACDGVDQDCDGVVDELATCWGCVDSAPWLYCATGAGWEHAAAVCAALGSRLAVVADDVTNASLVATLTAYGAGSTWIGLTDADTEGTFLWTNGAPVSWTAWAAGQPDDASGEDCVSLDPVTSAWSDWDCGGDKAFACGG